MKRTNYASYDHTPVYTLKELLSFCAENYGEKTAFRFQVRKETAERTYAQFREEAESLGTWLFANGYRDCRIAVFGENSYEWILTHFAVTGGDNVIVPIDKDLEPEQISWLLRDSECKAFFYSKSYEDIADVLKQTEPEVSFYCMNEIPGMIEAGKALTANGERSYIEQPVSKDDLASIVYTSGTTGRPKGVMLTHGNFCASMYGACCNVLISGSQILLLPLHHAFGLTAGVFSEMYYGLTTCINKSLKRLSDDFQKYKPQHLFAVPLVVETLYKNIWSAAKKQGKDKALKNLISVSDFLLKCGIDLRKKLFASVLSAFGGNLGLIISGGAPIDEKYIKGFHSLGIEILNGYGITECGPIVSVNRNRFNIPGSVGLPLCCNEVKIADDGEILVRGDNVMIGYNKNEEENRKVFTDGWFRTGDLGMIDEYGALHITGRIKNLIILANGENIPAESIEEEIYTIPYVKEAIVYGQDDQITAELFLDEDVPGAREKIDEDIRTVNRRLPQIRNIGKIIVRDQEFPKTTTKKIIRNQRG